MFASAYGSRTFALTATVGTNAGQLIEISKSIVHPEYNAQKHINDIALHKLKNSVTFTKRVRPACLPYEEVSFQSEAKLQAVGIGLFLEGKFLISAGHYNNYYPCLLYTSRCA